MHIYILPPHAPPPPPPHAPLELQACPKAEWVGPLFLGQVLRLREVLVGGAHLV